MPSDVDFRPVHAFYAAVSDVFGDGLDRLSLRDFFITKERDKPLLYNALAETDMPYKVTIKKGGRRSLEQNAYLWGVCYETLLNHGLRDDGWRAEDLHEYFLGEFHGWETLKGLDKTRMRPVERSSGKTIAEFMEFLDFVIQKAAERGVVIPDADKEWQE